jgi:hypothetical protein
VTVTGMLRTAAVATALVGAIDPSWTAPRRAPAPVDLIVAADDAEAVDDVRRRLTSSLKDDVIFDSDAEPVGVVLVGGHGALTRMRRDDLPVSTVSLAQPAAPNVRIVAAGDPDRVRAGWAATFTATVEARGVAGRTSRIVLEERGVELAHVDHGWTRDSERFEATLRHTPPAIGTSIVTLRVLPLEGESETSDNAVDLRLVASGQRLRVLVHEPRPSWNVTFVRRALEEDPSFDVSTSVQASRGLAVRAGSPPAALSAEALNLFDAVLIGAPEELRASEIAALRTFARRRGGAVVLLPDRRPSGRYMELIPFPQFDEVLVEAGVELRSSVGPSLRASELAVHRAGVQGGEVLASFDRGTADRGQRERPVVLEWPDGAGRVIFSGAMDAWRFRAAADDGFGRFWRTRIAEAALAAPARMEIAIRPGVPRPGADMTIRARLRRTELDESPGRTRIPAVRARLIGADGRVEAIRLWPTAEQGVFEGHVEAPPAGTYDLQVTTATGVTVDEVVTVAAEARHPAGRVEDNERALRTIATSTGGVAVTEADLAPLERQLRALSSGEVERTIRPARSMVLAIVFATLLCAEWGIRRRRGRA